MSYFSGKTAVVTGAASGLGRGLVLELLRRGSQVYALDIDIEKLQNLQNDSWGESGPKLKIQKLDVSDQTEWANYLTSMPHLDFLFNNAGIALVGETRNVELTAWMKVINVNLMGSLTGSVVAYQKMSKQGRGHIVNIASFAGLVGLPVASAYSVSKAALIMMSQMLRAEGASNNIKVSAACPGFIRTQIFKNAEYIGSSSSKVIQQMPFPMIEVEVAVKKILAGVECNKELILLPGHIQVIWLICRLMPAIGRIMQMISLREFRRHN